MLSAATLDEFARAPVRRYVATDDAISFATETLAGLVVWGMPSAARIDALTKLHEGLPLPEPHAAYVDVRGIDLSVGADAFAALVGWVKGRDAWLAKRLRRLAIVRPEGLLGAAVAGFFALVPAPFSFDVFVTPAAALAWLGEENGAALAAEIDGIIADVAGVGDPLRRLRLVLESRRGRLTVTEAARALAVSERSLQRKLAALGTSFQHEQNAARVRLAKRLMLESDEPLSRVALEVGCRSLSHFSGLFRKIEGVTPSAWRQERRNAATR